METLTVHIPSISCPHCIMTIKRELADIAGVTNVDGSLDTKTITVTWNSPADWTTIKETLVDIGYSPEE